MKARGTDLRKDATFKGFESWWNHIQMHIKMHLYIILLLLFLHLSAYLVVNYFYRHEYWSAGLLYFWKAFQLGDFQHMNKAVSYLMRVALSTKRFFILCGAVWFLYPFLLSYFKARAKKQSEDRFIAGAKIVSPKEVNAGVKKWRIKLGEVKVPLEAENQHFLVIGAPGVGKTQCLYSVLDVIHPEGKGVVYDYKGDYVQKYYDFEKDILFNPLDERGLKWNIFQEIDTLMDIDTIAHSLIPEAYHADAFWNDAARAVFSGILQYLWQKNERRMTSLWEIVSSPVEKISKCLAEINHPGHAFIQDASSKQAMSVISVMMQYVMWLRYCAVDTDDSFRLKDWLVNGEPGFIFITNYPDLEKTLRPILSLMVDLLGRKLLSLVDDYNRRVFFLLDEFGTLQKLTTIKNLLTLSRSKGGSVWIGIQDTGQVDKIYTPQLRQAIFNACGSSVMFRVTDPDTMEYLSKRIGDVEVSHAEETISMGVEDVRDGISLVRREKTKRLILPSEFAVLQTGECFVRIVGKHVCKTHIKYKPRQDRNEPFILRTGLRLDEIFSEQKEVAQSVEDLGLKIGVKRDRGQERETKEEDRKETKEGPDIAGEIEILE